MQQMNMDIDYSPYDEVSYLQFLNKAIFSHPNYPRLASAIQAILEGRIDIQVINKKQFCESVLNHMTRGEKIIIPIVKK